jgi:hypothetical protein
MNDQEMRERMKCQVVVMTMDLERAGVEMKELYIKSWIAENAERFNRVYAETEKIFRG